MNSGILIAIDKYHDDLQSPVSNYVSTWMFQTMHRNLPIYQYNVRIPTHYKDKALQIVDAICSESGRDLSELDWYELLKWIQVCSDLKEEDAKRLCCILIPFENINEIIEKDESLFSDEGLFMDSLDDQLFSKKIMMALSVLNKREREIIELRYGFGSEQEMTLNDLGEMYGLTRERIRQIEVKAILKMKQYIHRNKLSDGMYFDFSEDELYPDRKIPTKRRKNPKRKK